MNAVDPPVTLLASALEPKGPSTQDIGSSPQTSLSFRLLEFENGADRYARVSTDAQTLAAQRAAARTRLCD